MSSAVIKYSLLTFPAASLGLGYWQIRRLEWKKGVIANLEKRLNEEPIDLMTIDSLKDLESLEYRRVRARGHYDQNLKHQIFMKPRPLVVNKEAIYRGRTALQSNVGVNVITPFCIDGTDLRILVNRGWLASKGKDNVADNAHLALGEGKTMDLVGIMRQTDKRPRYGLKNNESTNEWPLRDVDALAKALGTAPIFIDAEQNESRQEGPIGGQTQLNVRNEHLNYAITWFSLAIFLYVMWHSKYGNFKVLFRRRNR